MGYYDNDNQFKERLLFGLLMAVVVGLVLAVRAGWRWLMG